ncbi:EAL domain-containing protein [Niveispirillum sp.]|uniref:EAL domain-containing protein n=1 Tax=Niveispirillum sp. TaxID=1917217 RepID=UPI001B5BDF73|nr:EAL domain-containing protein [Niveispirillum sp.]MBP7334866.1 EAL domain-containing protein [Niveispirillum sp.]
MHCPECERIKALVHPANRLLLAPPTAHTRQKLMEIAKRRRLTLVAVDDPTCLDIRLLRADMDSFLTEANGALSVEETDHCRALLLDGEREPTLSDYLSTRTLRWVIAAVKGQWLVTMLEKDRLFSMLQPICRPDGSVFGYEALLRGREENGDLVSAGSLLSVASETQLMFTLDLAARREAIKAFAKRRPSGAKLFVNFNPSSIYDPAYCLRTTQTYVREMGLNPSDIVFEVTETTEVKDQAHLRGILAFYRQSGFRVALDDIGAGFSGLNMLQELRPDYVKIDMALIRGIEQDHYKQSIVRHLVGIAGDTGARIVAEGIETDAERDWVRTANVDLMQGYLLGRPAAA